MFAPPPVSTVASSSPVSASMKLAEPSERLPVPTMWVSPRNSELTGHRDVGDAVDDLLGRGVDDQHLVLGRVGDGEQLAVDGHPAAAAAGAGVVLVGAVDVAHLPGADVEHTDGVLALHADERLLVVRGDVDVARPVADVEDLGDLRAAVGLHVDHADAAAALQRDDEVPAVAGVGAVQRSRDVAVGGLGELEEVGLEVVVGVDDHHLVAEAGVGDDPALVGLR
jgi:hypothetical protein